MSETTAVEYRCDLCGQPIKNTWICTAGGGRAHLHCYHVAHPAPEQADFRGVLSNGDDRVFVNQLLLELVPERTQEIVVLRYNNHIRALNERRVAS